jgi:hypothetical protein
MKSCVVASLRGRKKHVMQTTNMTGGKHSPNSASGGQGMYFMPGQVQSQGSACEIDGGQSDARVDLSRMKKIFSSGW